MKQKFSKSILGFMVLFFMHSIGLADNPIIQTRYTSDPAPMVYGDTMFVYTGHDEDGATYFEMNDWSLYSSTDMVNWTDRGTILSYKDFSWSEPNAAWASQCVEKNGKFYFYVTTIPLVINARSVGVAVADHPAGPFKDAIGEPLLSRSWDYIDPTVFVDDNGETYLYLGNPNLYYIKLNEDMISYSSSVVKNEMTVEAFGNKDGKFSYTEGPWFYKRNEIYYMVYAAGGIPEHVAYSTSTSPTGPWEYQGIIMKNQGGSFTNHPGIVDFKGRSFFFYHNGALPGGGGFTRSVAVEEFTYDSDGKIPQLDMTPMGIEKPIHFLNPYNRIEAETMAFSKGLKSNQNSIRGVYITQIHNGDYIKIRSVNFGDTGADSMVVAVAGTNNGSIEIRLDKETGPLIGTVNVLSTGGVNTWKELVGAIDNTTGVHDVYFLFKGAASIELFNFDYWYFISNALIIPQSPYKGIANDIPGKIEVEEYDFGGQNKAYYDNDTENQGGEYREDMVDIVGDDLKNYMIGYTEAGEWLEYTVNVKEATTYHFKMRVSSGAESSSFRLFLDNQAITDTIFIETTSDWNTYTEIEGMTSPVSSGEQVLKLLITGSFINLDWIEFEEASILTSKQPQVQKQSVQTYKVFSMQGQYLGEVQSNSFHDCKKILHERFPINMYVVEDSHHVYRVIK